MGKPDWSFYVVMVITLIMLIGVLISYINKQNKTEETPEERDRKFDERVQWRIDLEKKLGVWDDPDLQKPKKRSRKITQKVKDDVWNRDGGKCVECGSNENLEFDHIIPHSKGGANTYRNIQLLCQDCNRTKSAKIG